MFAWPGYLASNRPRDWDLLPTDSPWRTGMKPRERFVELGLSNDGTIILTLDAYEHPDCIQIMPIHKPTWINASRKHSGYQTTSIQPNVDSVRNDAR